MTNHTEIQLRIKKAVQTAIFETGKVEGGNDITLTNTDVVEALLEVTGFWASVHGFEDCTSTDLAFKYAITIQSHIERYHPLIKSGKLPFNIVPRKAGN